MTLFQYLDRAVRANVIDHALRVAIDAEGRVSFYIHPSNQDGDTREYIIEDTTLGHKTSKKMTVVRDNWRVKRIDEDA